MKVIEMIVVIIIILIVIAAFPTTSDGWIPSSTINKLILSFLVVFIVPALYMAANKGKGTNGDEQEIDEDRNGIERVVCPKCGMEHDMDYPKCPYCKYAPDRNA